jgi:hypothetical protein
LFRPYDLKYTVSFNRHGSKYHLVEWFAAICLYHMTGANISFKRYSYGPETWKRKKLKEIVGVNGAAFLERGGGIKGFPPDLLLYDQEGRLIRFAEVKGPNDRLHQRQQKDFTRIRKRFRKKIELVRVRYV